MLSYFAYAPDFTGGVYVAAADVTGDGRQDIVTGPGAGGGPDVRVWGGPAYTAVAGFFAYDSGFNGGVSVAADDLDGDGAAEIVTGAGAGGTPHVRAFDGRSLAPTVGFYAYPFSGVGPFNGPGPAPPALPPIALPPGTNPGVGGGGGPGTGGSGAGGGGGGGESGGGGGGGGPGGGGGSGVDTTAPTVALTATPPALTNEAVRITGRVTDDLSAVARLEASVDGGAFAAIPLDADGVFAVDPPLALDGTADGPHSVRFRAADAAGNATTDDVAVAAFTLDTLAPTVTGFPAGTLRVAPSELALTFSEPVAGVSPSAFILAGADGTPVPVAAVEVDGAAARLLLAGPLADGAYTLAVSGVTDAAGNALAGAGPFPFTIADPTGVTALSPADGTEMVSLTRETVVRFDEPIDPATVTADSLYLLAKGGVLPGRVRVSATNLFATFFPDEPLPESTAVRVVVDGSKITGRDGLALDADGDGEPGGVAQADFRTLPLTLIPGTRVFGYVYDSYAKNPDGSDVPVVGATISLDARPDIRAVTDAAGYFELGAQDLDGDGAADGLPAPEFFVHVDGGTGTSAVLEAGSKYATLGKPFHSVPGQRVQLRMDGSPGDVDPAAPGVQFHMYLPPMYEADIVPLDPARDQAVGFGPSAAAQFADLFPGLTPAERDLLGLMSVTYPAGSAIDEDGTVMNRATIVPVNPLRLPAPLPPGQDPKLVISVQAGTAAGFNLAGGNISFDVPAPVTFPNLEGLAPGEQSLIWSFDHDAGKWVIIGNGTVSADGRTITSNPGVGILAPGWHFTISGTTLEVPLAKSNYYVCGAGDDFRYADNPSVPFPVNLLVGATSLIPAFVLETNMGLYVRGFGGSTGGPLMDNFVAGGGAPMTFRDGSELSNAIEATDTFAGLKDKIAEAIQKDIQKQADSGSIDNRSITIPRSLASNRSYWWDSAFLTVTIGSVQGTEVSMRDFSATGSIIGPEVGGTGSYSATLRFKMCDDFGVGLDDISGLKAGSVLLDMWVLQHIKSDGTNYRPFVINMEMDVPISGTFVIPPGYEDVDINIANLVARPDLLPSALLVEGVPDVSGFGVDPSIHYRLDVGGTEFAGSGSPETVFESVVLPPNRFFTLSAYQPSTNLSVSLSGVSNASGSLTAGTGILGSVARFQLTDLGGIDEDGDGVPDIGEYVLGTDPASADSDGDGITDAAELEQGLNPLDGVAFPTGVIASLPVPGAAEAVAVADDLVFVATGPHGLAIVDGAKFDAPILLGQIDLAGTATDVAVDRSRNVAAVATGAALVLVDIADPMTPTVRQTVNVGASQVEVVNGFAFAASGNGLTVVDLATGEIVRRVSLPGSGSVTGLAAEGRYLYAFVSGSDTLVVVDVGRPEETAVVGQLQVSIASTNVGVFAGNDTVWLAGSGLTTVDVSDPAAPKLVSAADSFFTAGRVALNGSGLGLILPDGGNSVSVYDTSDPTKTAEFLTRFNLSGLARGVAISRGIGYVAAGGRLEVVNYRPFDTAGVAPTASLIAAVDDADPAVDGIQVVEGSPISVRAAVSDDVQVRSVEFLVNGVSVGTDVAFPFDAVLTAPPAAAGGTLTVQVRATDTGGNVTLSDPLTVQIVPDTFAPTVERVEPADGSSRFTGTRTLRVRFSESLDPAAINAGVFRLTAAGADGTFGTADDAAVAVEVTGRDRDRLVQVTAAELPEGLYRLAIDRTQVRDPAGNVLGAGDLVTTFSVLARPTVDALFALTGEAKVGAFVLAGTDIQLGVAGDGSLISSAPPRVGLAFAGTDFLTEGDPLAGFTVGFNGTNYTNAARSRGTDFAMALQDLSAGAFHGFRAEAVIGGVLKVERVVVWADGDQHLTFAVRLTNVGPATLTNVAFLENHDPDQGTPIGVGADTTNDVVLDGALGLAGVVTDTFPAGLTMGFGSADPRAVVSIEGFFVNDPFAVIDTPVDPDGGRGDTGLNLAFDFGDLTSGESVTAAFALVLGRSTDEATAVYQSSGL